MFAWRRAAKMHAGQLPVASRNAGTSGLAFSQSPLGSIEIAAARSVRVSSPLAYSQTRHSRFGFMVHRFSWFAMWKLDCPPFLQKSHQYRRTRFDFMGTDRTGKLFSAQALFMLTGAFYVDRKAMVNSGGESRPATVNKKGSRTQSFRPMYLRCNLRLIPGMGAATAHGAEKRVKDRDSRSSVRPVHQTGGGVETRTGE